MAETLNKADIAPQDGADDDRYDPTFDPESLWWLLSDGQPRTRMHIDLDMLLTRMQHAGLAADACEANAEVQRLRAVRDGREIKILEVSPSEGEDMPRRKPFAVIRTTIAEVDLEIDRIGIRVAAAEDAMDIAKRAMARLEAERCTLGVSAIKSAGQPESLPEAIAQPQAPGETEVDVSKPGLGPFAQSLVNAGIKVEGGVIIPTGQSDSIEDVVSMGDPSVVDKVLKNMARADKAAQARSVHSRDLGVALYPLPLGGFAKHIGAADLENERTGIEREIGPPQVLGVITDTDT